ncbi:MAG: class I SAM-dependent methyltransferase [Thermodesulfovibrionales bacterium]
MKKPVSKRIRSALRKLPFSRPSAFTGDVSEAVVPKGHFCFPPGHFYSPIPNIEEIKHREEEIFQLKNIPKEIPGVDLNAEGQLALLDNFRNYYKDLPFGSPDKEKLRFHFENHSYSHSDAIILYCMIRHLKPKKIIEVGSGHSSCVTLDTNELFFQNSIICTFIEPYPELLLSLISKRDKKSINIIQKNLQDVDLAVFSELDEGDILFIDSTHVSKINSDVNYIFFKLLPALKRGVYIHFHDIFYPFEYPKEWIYEGLAWNEAYLLRAFLQYSSSFKIQFFNTYLECFYRDKFFNEMPLPLKYAGASIWIKKIGLHESFLQPETLGQS